MATHRFVDNWSDGSNTESGGVTLTDTGGLVLSIVLAGGDVNKPLQAVFTKTLLSGLYILGMTGGCTIKTNTTTGVDTITLPAAGVPCSWNKSNGLTNPFSADVTHFYVTNALASTANEVRIKVLGNFSV